MPYFILVRYKAHCVVKNKFQNLIYNWLLTEHYICQVTVKISNLWVSEVSLIANPRETNAQLLQLWTNRVLKKEWWQLDCVWKCDICYCLVCTKVTGDDFNQSFRQSNKPNLDRGKKIIDRLITLVTASADVETLIELQATSFHRHKCPQI